VRSRDVRHVGLLVSAVGVISGVGARRAHAQELPSVGALRGVATDSVHHAPLAGATILASREDSQADASRFSAATDDRGRFTWGALPSGRYTLNIEQSWLDSVGISTFPVEATVRPGETTTVELATPSAATLRQVLCGSAADDTAKKGMALGAVLVAGTGAPVVGAQVIAIWHDFTFDVRAKRLISQPRGTAVHTDRTGVYWICGLPAAQTLSLQAQLDSGHYSGLIETEVPPAGALVRIFYVDVSNTATASTRPGSVRGTVRGTDGQAVPNARVSEFGSDRAATTDLLGHFRLTGLRYGTQAIDVVALGFYPTRVAVDVGAAPADDVTIRMQAVAVVLKSIVTNGQRATTLNRIEMIAPGFAFRRKEGFGVFIIADSIEKLRAIYTSYLFRAVPGFTVVGEGSQAVIASSRLAGSLAGRPCYPDMYIDGTHVSVGEVNLIAPPDVLAMEAYRAGEPAPVEFPANACGAILIWTK